MTRVISRVAIAAAVICMTAGLARAGQTTSSMKESKNFTVISVDGNTLVVRLPEGTRELKVADDFRFMINGQPMSVHQLKAGMKGTATITTTTTVTPVTVTEVKNGTVMQSSGSSIIVRTEQGFKSFTQGEVDKRGVKIYKNGKPAELSDFHSGDKLSATIVTSMPPHVMTQKEVDATLPTAMASSAAGGGAAAGGSSGSGGSSAAARKAPASSGTLASSSSSGSGSTPGGSGKTLPKTASTWPLLLLASAAMLAIGLGLTITRRVIG